MIHINATRIYWSEAKLLCFIWKVNCTYSYQNIDQAVICVLLLSMGSTLQIESISNRFFMFSFINIQDTIFSHLFKNMVTYSKFSEQTFVFSTKTYNLFNQTNTWTIFVVITWFQDWTFSLLWQHPVFKANINVQNSFETIGFICNCFKMVEYYFCQEKQPLFQWFFSWEPDERFVYIFNDKQLYICFSS